MAERREVDRALMDYFLLPKRRNEMPGRNESGERLLEMCAEQELVVGNSWFKKNDVYKYTRIRMAEGRVVDKALMDYVLLS